MFILSSIIPAALDFRPPRTNVFNPTSRQTATQRFYDNMFLNVLHFLVFYQHVVAQIDYSLSRVLNSQPQLTNFTALLSLFPVLLTQASVGNFTSNYTPLLKV